LARAGIVAQSREAAERWSSQVPAQASTSNVRDHHEKNGAGTEDDEPVLEELLETELEESL
jgi:hypothetical protein